MTPIDRPRGEQLAAPRAAEPAAAERDDPLLESTRIHRQPTPGAAAPRTDDTRSLAHLVRELRDETTELLRQEIALVRAEVGDSVSRMLRNAGLLGAGALVALLGLVFILAAIATLIAAALADAGVEAPTAAWLGPMIVGVVVAVVGVAMVQKARSTLRRTHLYPDQTVETMRENAQWIRSRATTQRSQAS